MFLDLHTAIFVSNLLNDVYSVTESKSYTTDDIHERTERAYLYSPGRHSEMSCSAGLRD